MVSNIEYAKRMVELVFGSGDDLTGEELEDNLCWDYDCSEFYTAHGATRGVIVCKNRNVVIKSSWVQDGIDMCKAEYAAYIGAKSRKLQNYFAKVYGSFEYRGWTFFVYEKVDNVGCVCDYFHGIRDELRPYAYSELEYCYKFLKRSYIAERLLSFFEDYDINDLHIGNFGYDERKKHIVFVDYAGFW